MTDNYTDLARCMGCAPHEVSDLIQQHAPWNGKPACDDALRERAAVVAWLREEERLHEAHGSRLVASSLRHLGDIIERGEHRREGDE